MLRNTRNDGAAVFRPAQAGAISIFTILILAIVFAAGAGAMWGVGTLLVDIQEKKLEAKLSPVPLTPIAQNEVDPEIWGHNFPRQLDSFKKTADDTVGTPFGGSVPYSKLERNPALVRLWAGYAFSKDHNEDRGHHYALTDQLKTQRVTLVSQPGACANCHAAEAPQLIESMGWEAFNRTPYNELKEKLHTGTSCHDCHDPKTMVLRITRPAFLQAMERRGVDLSKATRQEMRTYVCAQCHVEYYFAGENKLLTLPWDNGTTVDAIADYYDTLKFKDWTHKETGTPMIKIQHPEFELWGTGLHARSGVSCADCHMPYVREGAIKVSDHWVRSPLTNINQACQTCHRMDDQALRDRIISIQTRTSELLKRAEEAQIDAIDAIAAAQKEGASDADLATARGLHRRASLYWDFVSSENSTGFHSPQETARILAVAVDTARQAQLAVLKIPRKQG